MHIPVVQKVMKVNDELAAANRQQLLEAGVVALNFIGAPGSGKTSLIEASLSQIGDTLRVGVIEGDPETTLDAERINRFGVPVIQIETAGGCHLEANLVKQALSQLPLKDLDLLLIENVGNMVCPVEFDLGEMGRVAVVSVAEGDDKPAKYPKLFRTADVVVLNKIDLLPHVDFNAARFHEYLVRVKPGLQVLRVSCKTGEGVDAWVTWLRLRAKTGLQAPQPV